MKHSETRTNLSVHVLILVTAALLVWGYWPGWVDIVRTWMSDPDYNHGFIVIPVSLWLLWQRKDQLLSTEISPSWWGGLVLAVAGLIRFAGAEFFLHEFDTWSIPVWVAGVVLLFGGWQLLRLTAGSIAFLWFMTPLPSTLTMMLSMPLQKVSAVLSTWTLHLFAQPAVRQGTTIILGDQMLEVERACSGLRICYGILALAVAYVVLTRPGLFRSIVLILVSVPVAIVANSVRVTGTGLLFLVVSGEKAHQYSHDFAGLLMLPLAISMFWAVHKSLEKTVAVFEDSLRSGLIMMAKLATVVAVVGTGLYFWQQHQADKGIGNLLLVAERHQTAGNAALEKDDRRVAGVELSKALAYLDRYCRSRPEDVEGAKRFAEISEKLAFGRQGLSRAARAFERYWKLKPEDQDLGFKQVEFAIAAGDYSLAMNGATQLQKVIPATDEKHLQAFQLFLRAKVADAEAFPSNQKWEEVADVLKSGIEKKLAPVVCAFQLSVLYREKTVGEMPLDARLVASEQVITKLVQDLPNDALAWYAHHTYYSKFPATEVPADVIEGQGEPTVDEKNPDADLDRAIALASENPVPSTLPIWLSAAERALSRQQFDEAKELYNKAITANPSHYLAWLQLAKIESGIVDGGIRTGEQSAEQRAAAVAILRRGLEQPELKNEILLRAELLRHLVSSIDAEQSKAAMGEIASLRQELARLPREISMPLSLELSVIEADGFFRSGETAKAISILEPLLKTGVMDDIKVPDGALNNAWGRLGAYYTKQGRGELASYAYQKAASVATGNVQSELLRAFNAERLNRSGEASDLYQEIATRLGNAPEPWVGRARNELMRQLGRPPADRDFSAFSVAMEKAKETGASPEELAVIDARYKAASGQISEALSTLEAAAVETPNAADVWRSLAVLRHMNKDLSGAEAAVVEFEKITNDKLQSATLKAELAGRLGDWETAKRNLSEQLSATGSVEERRQLLRQIVQIDLLTNQPDSAESLLKNFSEEQPADVQAQVQYAEFLWLRERYELMEQVEAKIRTLEGETGSQWKDLKARRLLDIALRTSEKDQRQELISEATALVGQLTEGSIGQSQLETLYGRLAVLKNDFVTAAGHFEAAWKSGNANERLAVELISALQLSNSDLLEVYFSQMPELVAASPRLFDLALISRSVSAFGNVERATEIAQQFVANSPTSTSYVRLARALRLNVNVQGSAQTAHLKRIEDAYRKAIELNPKDPQARGEFLQFVFRDLNDKAGILREIEVVLNDNELTELDRKFIAAQICSEIGLDQQSGRYWEEAALLAEAGTDRNVEARVRGRAAEFYSPRDLSRAAFHAKKVVQLTPTDASNSLRLGALLLDMNTEESLTEAAGLVETIRESISAGGKSKAADRSKRLLAMILYRGVLVAPQAFEKTASLNQSADLLKSLSEPDQNDEVRLAMINLAQGDSKSAVQRLSEQVMNSTASAFAVQSFVEIGQDQFSDDVSVSETVTQVLDRLQGEMSTSLLALDLRLRPKTLSSDVVQEISDQFLDRVFPLIPDATAKGNALQGMLEVMLKRGYSSTGVKLLGREINGLSETEKLNALMILLIRSEAAAREYGPELDRLLAARLPEIKDKSLRRVAADYYFMRAEWNNAESLYNEVATGESKDVAAINNLAILIGESKQQFDESERLIQEAMAKLEADPTMAGNNGFLLDSRAQLLIMAGKYDDAISVLEPLSRSAFADATVYLHMAYCLKQLQRLDESKVAFQRAVFMGITRVPLAPMDRRIVEELSSLYPELMVSRSQREIK